MIALSLALAFVALCAWDAFRRRLSLEHGSLRAELEALREDAGALRRDVAAALELAPRLDQAERALEQLRSVQSRTAAGVQTLTGARKRRAGL